MKNPLVNIPVISHNRLKELVSETIRNGVTFISIKAITQQNKLNKGRGDNTLLKVLKIDPEKIKKHTYITALISNGSVSYKDFVNNRLTKETYPDKPEEFKPVERKWGERLNNAVVTYNNNLYLTVYYLANNEPTVFYTYNGKPFDIHDPKLDPWRKPEKKEGTRQGLENPIVVRDYKFDNIIEISINGNISEVKK